jgi:hypothetical protein
MILLEVRGAYPVRESRGRGSPTATEPQSKSNKIPAIRDPQHPTSAKSTKQRIAAAFDFHPRSRNTDVASFNLDIPVSSFVRLLHGKAAASGYLTAKHWTELWRMLRDSATAERTAQPLRTCTCGWLRCHMNHKPTLQPRDTARQRGHRGQPGSTRQAIGLISRRLGQRPLT